MILKLLNKKYMKVSQKSYHIQQASEGRGCMGESMWCTDFNYSQATQYHIQYYVSGKTVFTVHIYIYIIHFYY